MKESLRKLLEPPTRLFLHDHPEWEDEVKLVEIGGEVEVAFSLNCCLAFAAWAKDSGLGDPEKCATFMRDFERAVADQLGGG